MIAIWIANRANPLITQVTPTIAPLHWHWFIAMFDCNVFFNVFFNERSMYLRGAMVDGISMGRKLLKIGDLNDRQPGIAPSLLYHCYIIVIWHCVLALFLAWWVGNGGLAWWVGMVGWHGVWRCGKIVSYGMN